MHGLVNRSIQGFVQDNFGRARWVEIAHLAGLEFVEFETMLHYPDRMTLQVIDAITRTFGTPYDTVLEDVGTYLVANPKVQAVRRLLRFGGADFVEFLHSLDELPERARLAVDDLDPPRLELREHSCNMFSLRVDSRYPGCGHVLVGMLRAMADDYGTLVLLEHMGRVQRSELIDITVIETAFADGRAFDLGARAVG
ncbi:heme NO-binding domain-containing protein [Shimia biformata]|uniref:heme NO-binding domain-containing protein n=1 Tax=Shimia biformata TaxID=1294299 RepID=UPI00194F7484|nr:heme NO-binding domain-containing protein [Shimia biformata]